MRDFNKRICYVYVLLIKAQSYENVLDDYYKQITILLFYYIFYNTVFQCFVKIKVQ